MSIDNDIASRAKIDAEGTGFTQDDDDLLPNGTQSVWAAPDNANGFPPHWIFGSPEKLIDSRVLETEMSNQRRDLSFKEFDERLRDFLSLCLPNEAIRYEDPILVSLLSNKGYNKVYNDIL